LINFLRFCAYAKDTMGPLSPGTKSGRAQAGPSRAADPQAKLRGKAINANIQL